MAYTAHLTAGVGTEHELVILDDRGTPAHEIELPTAVDRPEEADPTLGEFGWRRTAEWVGVDDGWTAVVVRGS